MALGGGPRIERIRSLCDHRPVSPREGQLNRHSNPPFDAAGDPGAARTDFLGEPADFRAIFERASLGLVVADELGRISACNEAFERMIGYERGELRGMAVAAVTHPEDVTATREAVEEVASGRRQGVQMDKRYLRKDGSFFWGRVTISAVRSVRSSNAVTIAMVEDISERKRIEAEHAQLESRLFQAQKMEAAGRLAAGVAHNFNNLLTAISGYCELALMKLTGPSDVVGDVEQIRRAAARGTEMTRDLLAFSRRERRVSERLDLNELITEMRPLLEQLLGEDVDLIVAPAPVPALLDGDRSQLEQVIVNLVVNARDAMPDGGRVLVRAQELDPVQAPVDPSSASGRWLALIVEDSGTGMDEQTRARIFEPFFTTKSAAKGTGLGLSSALGMVEAVGGRIAVESAPGEGTTFTVWLPAAANSRPQ